MYSYLYLLPQSSPAPLGLVFANFMLCSFAGVSAFHSLARLDLSSTLRFDFRPYHALTLAVGVALTAFVPLAATAHADVPAPLITSTAFLTLEFAAGM